MILLCRCATILAGIASMAWPSMAQPQGTRVAGISPDTQATDTTALAVLRASIRQSSPDLVAKRLALGAAEARLRAAGFAPASVFTGEVEDVPRGVDVGQAGSIRLTLDHEFVGGARLLAARSVASAEVERATAELRATENRLVWVAQQALTRAIDWVVIARRLAAEDSLLASVQSSVQTRFAVGDARYVDVLRLRTERLRAGSDRALAVSEGDIARQELLGLVTDRDSSGALGRDRLDSLLTARRAMPQLASGLTAAPNIDSVLAMSGAVRLADAAVGQAQALRDLALANLRARVTAFVGVQRFAADQGSHSLGPVFGGSISLPFTASRANSLAADAATQELAAAVGQRVASLASVRTELLMARNRYETARLRLATYDAALLRGAREERETALASYRNGSLSLIELLDFERALARAEIDRLRSEIEAAVALSDLLTGGTTVTAGGALRTSTPSPQIAP